MSQQEAAALVEYLATQVGLGYTIVTWNGMGFDFDILAEESGMLAECKRLAVEHVDMMFHVLCRLGYGVGLNAAAKGMNLAGKPEGMNGGIAPVLWAERKREEVLHYVTQDVRTTLELANACEAQCAMRWIARSGKLRSMALPGEWLTVEAAARLPFAQHVVDGRSVAAGEVHGGWGEADVHVVGKFPGESRAVPRSRPS
jgi:hypothetical protein